jgi:DNA ligase-1
MAFLSLAWPAARCADARGSRSPSAAASVALMTEARADIDPGGYLVSEKLDGVRAIWDGRELRFRSGRHVPAPAWFIDALPACSLDGELWAGRNRFDVVSGTVRRVAPDDELWRAVRYMIFDLPGATGDFSVRATQIALLVRRSSTEVLGVVDQSTVSDRLSLRARLAEVVQGGGEGLVLHRADALWTAGRCESLLKLKPRQDAEAQVLAHEPGQGRLIDLMGALLVRNVEGVEFRIGSGFSDAQRRDPPPLGSWITYTHRGRTPTGVPRFASYWRPRDNDL